MSTAFFGQLFLKILKNRYDPVDLVVPCPRAAAPVAVAGAEVDCPVRPRGHFPHPPDVLDQPLHSLDRVRVVGSQADQRQAFAAQGAQQQLAL